MGLRDELVVVTPGGPDDGVREERITFNVPDAPGYAASGRAAVRDLLDAITEGREPLANGDAMVATLELVDAAYESARTGRSVRLD